ncbi:hypothetical protein ACKFKF_05035 [Phormidesmis sp. 146-12]
MVVSTQIVVSARRFLFALYLQNYDKARSLARLQILKHLLIAQAQRLVAG